jgi:predicted amino acid-binding ACT domain protein
MSNHEFSLVITVMGPDRAGMVSTLALEGLANELMVDLTLYEDFILSTSASSA